MPNDSCNFWLKSRKRNCKNKIYKNLTCKIHHNKKVYVKPTYCCICFEEFNINDYPQCCGHWIHMTCIYKTGKKICPICKLDLTFTSHQEVKFKKYILLNEENNHNNFITMPIEQELHLSNINFIPFN